MAYTDTKQTRPRFGQRFAHPGSTLDRPACRAAMAAALDACRAERASAGDTFLDWDDLEDEITQRRGRLAGRDR